jgi:hypothetical protein
MTSKERSLAAAFLSGLAILLCIVTIAQPYKNSPAIRSDGIGYHAWVQAIQRGSISFCEDKKILDTVGAISMVHPTENRCGNKYPPGVGITQAPFTLFLGRYNINQGFSAASHWIVLSLGSVLLLGTVFVTGKTLETVGCSTPAILSASIAGVFGTGLLHYATYDGSFSHIYSAFFFACTLFIARQHASEQATPRAQAATIAYAAFCVLLMLIRPTNLLLVLASTAVAASNETFTKTKKKNIALAGALALFFGLTFYLAYNFYHLGILTLSTYGREKMVPMATHTLQVFLSYERGLFTYYPITILLVSLGWLSKKRSIYTISIAVILGYGLIYGSWKSWYLGGGFGHRGFVDMAPLMILSLGLTIDHIRQLRWHRLLLALVSSLAVICIYVTATTQHAYWNSDYPFIGADQQMYWSTLLQNPKSKE